MAMVRQPPKKHSVDSQKESTSRCSSWKHACILPPGCAIPRSGHPYKDSHFNGKNAPDPLTPALCVSGAVNWDSSGGKVHPKMGIFLMGGRLSFLWNGPVVAPGHQPEVLKAAVGPLKRGCLASLYVHWMMHFGPGSQNNNSKASVI